MYTQLELMRKNIIGSVENIRFLSQEDKDMFRAAHINESAEVGRNDLPTLN